MKILLDESLPRKLGSDFGSAHEVWNVRDKGWLGQKNGALLKLMVEEQFDIFVTVDRNLPFQQNLEKVPLIIIILIAVDNRLQTLRNLIPKLLAKLSEAALNKVIEIS